MPTPVAIRLKRVLVALMPRSVMRSLRGRLERKHLQTVSELRVANTSALAALTPANLDVIFTNSQLAREWDDVSGEMALASIPERSDAVNSGDRRALYYLIRQLNPTSVLEIGTHIGGSTVHIALALRQNAANATLTTVDIVDVNDPVAQPWLAESAKLAPRDLIARIGMSDSVQFVISASVEFLAATTRQFDLVFLDGDHSAATVYQEVPLALRALRSGGIIVLHDYFPEGEPLWPDGNAIAGPWLAIERLRHEGARLAAIPLGELPWPTKQGTRRTSLAVLVRD